MVVDRLLQEAADRAPDAPALLEPTRSVTYGELNRLVNRVAQALRARGVSRGDRVVVAGENSVEFVGAYFGAMRAGAVAVPLPGGQRNDRLGKAIADCRPAACIVDAATAADDASGPALAEVGSVFVHRAPWKRGTPELRRRDLELSEVLAHAPDTPPAVRTIELDLAAIIYTSGSTGEPRGVMLTHRNIVSNTGSIVQYLRLTAQDRVMCVLPFYYVYGLSLLHTHVSVGGTVVIDNRFAYPSAVLQNMLEHRVTGFAGVPSTFAILLKRPDLDALTGSALRYVTQAGGAMHSERIKEWRARLPAVPFYVMYGATEATARLAYLEPSDLDGRLGSIGRPIPNVDLQILREDGSRTDVGETGEIVARGSNISCGYWKDPAETGERFTARGYRTGDLAYQDSEGYLFLVGRKSDMLKVGAHRVGPKEIEDALCQHPAVHEAAVVGMPHEILGEVPLAYVVLRTSVDGGVDALRAFCASRLPAHKVPMRLVEVPDLPRLPGVGKVDRRALRVAGGDV
jgi:long-chain acyl-CoA synthetase